MIKLFDHNADDVCSGEADSAIVGAVWSTIYNSIFWEILRNDINMTSIVKRHIIDVICGGFGPKVDGPMIMIEQQF